ncbi:hypothetical protein GCM10025858_22620 [Alicyclobacillus sacchari]|nr:hypothetical protein GCM10025858_22620 [Alicyclobacillus sacchari]
MARSLGIPAVVGLGEITANVQAGQMIAVDGTAGVVVVNPDSEEQASFSNRAAGEAEAKARLLTLKDEPSQTLDGRRVELAGNIGTPRMSTQCLQTAARVSVCSAPSSCI